MLSILVAIIAGCSVTAKESDTLTIAWLPNESGEDVKSARDEIGKLVEEATGKKVVHKTTTDYVITIESIANGNADIAYLGPQGYVEAHNKNDKVLPLVVSTGKSGTLEDAVYYSWLAVVKGNEEPFKDGSGFKLDNLAGKKFSFVSTSSTSGFKVPSNNIVNYFSAMDKYKDLTAEDLMEGGKDQFFSDVQFGGSHQGSAVNLLNGTVDVAAFCDSCVTNYVELVNGKLNAAGALYKVKDDAVEPFNTVQGKEFTLISSTPVLNSPFVVNSDKVSEETVKKLVDAFTSEKTTNNTNIFIVKDSGLKGMFSKTGKEAFLAVEDSWFEPVRALSK